ncbi:MAG: monovalent cation/H+ antiporter subunit D [Enhydrobacter sp.]|nr:MAG: monovalent cation/H+ antiporter subunit D [Enhydrobacter sp.]
MNHWPILPVVIPFVAAVLCMIAHDRGIGLQRALSAVSVGLLVLVSVVLLCQTASGDIAVYSLGNWPAPYGIVLVIDRLSALMVALMSALAVPVLLHASGGVDAQGRHFHALFQMQLAGLAGAFTTGDLFNLFVFFEILLLASYALLVHGGGPRRVRAGFAYLVLNLAGSAVFLIALGLLYGTFGTLNLADLTLVLPQLAPADQALARTALALLVAVFLLKAALLPLSFWLPPVYSAASAPVAALFAIMTKVGVYALLRVSAIGLDSSPLTAGLLDDWLPILALLTIATGTVGALAARGFAVVVANLILVSMGTLLVAIAASEARATAAALYYLPHTTLVTAGLFLLGDAIARQRGAAGDALIKGPPLAGLAALGGAYLVLALAISGLPPFSGFIGKLMVMQSLWSTGSGVVVWVALLLSGLVVALVLARAASAYFWEPGRGPGEPAVAPRSLAGSVALTILVVASPVLALAAGPVGGFAHAAAQQLHARQPYVTAVLGAVPQVERERRP